MISLRDLVRRVTGDTQLPPIRPTSLIAAGTTGNRPTPARVPASGTGAPGADIERTPVRPRSFNDDSIESTPRRRSRESTASRGQPRSRFAAAVRSPVIMRQAIVLREVLGPPVALRRDPED